MELDLEDRKPFIWRLEEALPDPDEGTGDMPESWPLTPRTRFVLWQALSSGETGLYLLLDDFNGEPDEESFKADFPRMTWRQPKEWWREMVKSCERLREAARTGRDLVPRTPAEEALIFLATNEEWRGGGEDQIKDDDWAKEQYEALPDLGEYDFTWDEILGSLTGDVDVEMCWDMSMDGIEDPENQWNKDAGMGDYRPSAWHKLFDRALPDD